MHNDTQHTAQHGTTQHSATQRSAAEQSRAGAEHLHSSAHNTAQSHYCSTIAAVLAKTLSA
eukprot:8983822-Alexandrium_andersonii.AAC.1